MKPSYDHRDTLSPHIRRLHLQLNDHLEKLGDTARAAGPTAAALESFDGYRLKIPFHFVTLRGHNLQRVGHHIHTTKMLPPIDCETVHGIRVTSPTRTLIDLAATATAAQLTAALDGALRDLKTTEDFLHRRIDTERTNRLTLAGYLVLQFTYDHLVKSPEWVVEQVAEALFQLRRAA